MKIEEKIKYIEKFTGLVFDSSYFDLDDSSGAVARKLRNMEVINQSNFDKIFPLTNKTNFWSNYIDEKPLNSYSILFVNLVYNLIKEYEVKYDQNRVKF